MLDEKEINKKTILVVDDEAVILNFVSMVLGRASYNVLLANSGESALVRSREHKGKIDLMLSDVQMPGITGVELGARLNIERPEMQVMLMSGFTSGMLILDDGWHFMHKPFVPIQLLSLVASSLARVAPEEIPNFSQHQS